MNIVTRYWRFALNGSHFSSVGLKSFIYVLYSLTTGGGLILHRLLLFSQNVEYQLNNTVVLITELVSALLFLYTGTLQSANTVSRVLSVLKLFINFLNRYNHMESNIGHSVSKHRT